MKPFVSLAAYLLLAASAFITLASAASAHADTIYTAQLDGGRGNQTGNSTVYVSAGSPLPLPNSFSNAFAQATAGPNDIGIYGVVTAAGNPASANEWVTAETTEEATLSDSLYLQNAPTNGILALYVNVNGLMITIGQGNTVLDGCGSLLENCVQYTQAQVELFGNAGGGGGCVALDSGYPQEQGCGLLSEGANLLLLSYSGSVVPLQLGFDATADCGALYDSDTNFEGSCSSSTLFLDTAQIASIVVEDANGNPVSGATATSLNGVDYILPSPTGVTPEPSSFVLLGTGIIGAVGAARRRFAL